MNMQIVAVIVVLIILFFWQKGKEKVDLKNDIVIPPLAPLDPQGISTVPGETTTKTIPDSGGIAYTVQPVTIPVNQSPYYWDETTWQRLFNANAFTNPETAVAIYSRRDIKDPEYR